MGNPMANTQIRLLVVDDEPALREVISSTLVARGYDVVTAKDGLEALDQLVESLPDMIISDLKMPRMSGFEFLAVVRQRFPHVPVIATSGEFWGKQVASRSTGRRLFGKGQLYDEPVVRHDCGIGCCFSHQAATSSGACKLLMRK